MDSLGDYLEKKRKRNEDLHIDTASGVKRARMLAEQSRKVVNSISKIHTPPSILKQGKVRHVSSVGYI